MTLTAHDAEQQLIKAIEDYAEATVQKPQNSMVNQFCVITHWQNIEYEGVHEYTIFANDNGAPVHQLIGLMHLAAAKLESE